jgi:antitoxin (DNA-binding transcriptional repressor) of toxin-antitoxin stability system
MSEQGAPRARVGVRELRQNLSVYLDRVKAGERLDVTEHGQLVAELGPPSSKPMSRLEQLIAEGTVTPGKGNLADLGPPIEMPPGSPSLSQTLQEMRAEETW